MTPETRTSLTTAAFATVPVVIVAILAIAYVGHGPGGQGSRVLPSSCNDLPGNFWALELDSGAGTPATRPYILATIDLSSRGGLKHNIEANWKTPNPGSYATEKTSEYDFDPASDCSASGTTLTLTFEPDKDGNGNPYPGLSVILSAPSSVSGTGSNPTSNWPTGSFVQVH
jgi:hypothetical protein